MKLSEVVICLIEQHKLVRRLLVLWACTLITGVTVVVFGQLELVTGPVAAAYATAVGLLSVVLGGYQWSRHKEVCEYGLQEPIPFPISQPGKEPGEGEPG